MHLSDRPQRFTVVAQAPSLGANGRDEVIRNLRKGVNEMKRMLVIVAAAAALGLAGNVYAAGDAAAGKAKAGGCGGCHGANGEGKDKNPAIAGKPEGEFVQALNDYKSGKRANPIMKTLATPLSDADMANLAA